MALCTNEILFGYTIGSKAPAIIGPLTIFPSGVYNGKSYYIWFESQIGANLIVRWSSIESRWEFGYDSGGFVLIGFLNYPPTDCPYNPFDPFFWVITIQEEWSNINSAAGNAILTEKTEDQECFEILVWNKQCEFAQCVLKYLTLLKFGSVPCELLEQLKNKKRILAILNCYDSRDIPTDSTNHNIFTYQEMKNLLNN